LVKPIGGTHFQPVNRFFEWLVVGPLQESYPATVAVLALLSGAGTYWLVRFLDVLWGPRARHRLLGFLFGTSCVLVGAAQWVAASSASLAVDFAAGASLGFVSWLATGSRRAYVGCVTATALAVGSWETALAMPALITLVWLAFARGWRPLRQTLWAQVPLYAVALAFVVYVELQPWHQAVTLPSIGSWLALLVVMVGRALTASVIGTGVPGGAQSTFDWVSAVGVGSVLVAAAVWLAVRRRLNWGAIALFGIGAVLVSIPVATTRAYLGAAEAGTTPRYLTFLPLLLAVAVAGAVQQERDGVLGPVHDRSTARSGEGAPAALRRARSTIGWGTIVLLGCAGYLFNLSRTFNGSQLGIESGRAATAQSDRIAAGVAALGRRGRYSLVDATVPFPVWYQGADGAGELSRLMPFWSTSVRPYGEGRIASIDTTGTVRWAFFHPHGPGTQYVRVVVLARARTTVTIHIIAANPTQPEDPRRVTMGPGVHSFIFPAWSTTVDTVTVTGPNVTLRARETGSITLGSPVTITAQ
jgi:hypothetical protein